MSYFDMIDRRQPSKPEPKLEEKVTPIPRLTLDQLAELPADYDPRTLITQAIIDREGINVHASELPAADLMLSLADFSKKYTPRKKLGRPPKAKP